MLVVRIFMGRCHCEFSINLKVSYYLISLGQSSTYCTPEICLMTMKQSLTIVANFVDDTAIMATADVTDTEISKNIRILSAGQTTEQRNVADKV